MRKIIALVALAIVSVVGCGNDDAGKNREDNSQDDLMRAVQNYSNAFLTGDMETSFNLLSERCQERMGRDEWSLIVESAESTYGSAMEIQEFDAELAGEMARVTYEFPVSAINQDREPWTMENGNWKVDDC